MEAEVVETSATSAFYVSIDHKMNKHHIEVAKRTGKEFKKNSIDYSN